ncbi:hypothetical protein FO519_008814 [Halicephalobus sp. NKZ332]|nr:hypothetical protein FO519_008814 [Halicephalobus sp. NKZ332]
MTKILLVFCFFIGSTFGKRDYLKECVIKFQDAIRDVCKMDPGTSEPCFNDDITDQYGYNIFSTITALSFECCDIACTSEVILRDFCCHDESCRKRCSTKNDIRIREAPLPVEKDSENLKDQIHTSEKSGDSSSTNENSAQKSRSKAAEFRYHRFRHRHHQKH